MPEDIFNGDDHTPAPTEPSLNIEDYVGEGKKYKTTEDFVKSRLEADKYIDHLQGEGKQLREELAKLGQSDNKLDELLDLIAKQQANAAPSNGEPTGNPESGEEVKTIDVNEIEQKIMEKLNAKSQEAQYEANLASVTQVMQEKWGNDASMKLQAKANELGESLQDLQNLAKTKPKLFLGLVMGNEQPASTPANQSVPSSSEDTSKKIDVSGSKKYSDFEKIRKEDPQRYFTPEVQNEMFKLAEQLGEEFYN